ncbi:1748_t:CDS:1, partial [Rhizophagus irregularis]
MTYFLDDDLATLPLFAPNIDEKHEIYLLIHQFIPSSLTTPSILPTQNSASFYRSYTTLCPPI